MTKSADYGIDAPTVARNMGILGGLGLILFAVERFGGPLWLKPLAHTGLGFGVGALWLFISSKFLKLQARDRLIEGLQLKGHEQVLDVGCGRGLLLIAAARRLKTGRAVGLDLWRTVDQSGNHPDVTRANAEVENVAHRIELVTGDMTKLPFADQSFDVLISSWALHNIPDAGGRAAALRDMVRVLKPGGRIAILDMTAALGYGRILREAGLHDVKTGFAGFTFIASFRVSGTRN